MNKGLMIPTLIGTCLAALLPCLVMADAPSDAAADASDADAKAADAKAADAKAAEGDSGSGA